MFPVGNDFDYQNMPTTGLYADIENVYIKKGDTNIFKFKIYDYVLNEFQIPTSATKMLEGNANFIKDVYIDHFVGGKAGGILFKRSGEWRAKTWINRSDLSYELGDWFDVKKIAFQSNGSDYTPFFLGNRFVDDDDNFNCRGITYYNGEYFTFDPEDDSPGGNDNLIDLINIVPTNKYAKRILIFNDSFSETLLESNLANQKTVIIGATHSDEVSNTCDDENELFDPINPNDTRKSYFKEFSYHIDEGLSNYFANILDAFDYEKTNNSLASEDAMISNSTLAELTCLETSYDVFHGTIENYKTIRFSNNIFVPSNIIVKAWGKLIIDPGVELSALYGTKIIVESGGTIEFNGTSDNPIILDLPLGGIDIYGNSNINMEYCTVKNADIGISFYNYNDNSDPTIKNCTFESNDIGAYVYSSTPWFYKNTFQNNSQNDILVMGKYSCPYLKKKYNDGTLTYNNVILGEAVEDKNASILLQPGGTIYLAEGNNKIIKSDDTEFAIRSGTLPAIGSDPLNARENYWGEFNIEEINGMFWPDANDNPWIDCSDFMLEPKSRDAKFKTAVALEEEGNKVEAKSIYEGLIPGNDNLALMSIPRMKNSSDVPSEFIEYANSIENELTGVNRQSLKKAKAEAYLEANNYNAALSQYMELRAEAETDEEIAEADLDIALLQMNEQITARVNGNWVSAGISSERFNELRTKVYDLRDRLLNRDSNPENQNSDKIGKFQITNSPNPFNPSTTLKYVVPQNSQIELSVYNLMGQKVRTLVNESKEEGEYSVVWNGKDNKGSQVASGVYFYRLSSGGIDKAKGKMLLIK